MTKGEAVDFVVRKQFIIKGRLFDASKATVVAIAYDLEGDGEIRYKDTLYRTPRGAFFVHAYANRRFQDGVVSVITDEAFELAPEEVVAWIEKNRAMVKDATGLPVYEEA